MKEPSRMSITRPIYVPIADSFFESSIMREELPVRFVMLALIRLALRAGADGKVDIDPQMFAMSINMPLADVEAAIRRLMEPDPFSSSPDEDGRRIAPVDPARPFRYWRIVNWEKYQHIVALANDAARKRADRAAAHTKKDSMDASENVQSRPVSSENGGTKTSTKNEVRKTKNDTGARGRFAPPTLAECVEFWKENKLNGTAEAFFHHYEAVGWRSGKAPLRKWESAAQGWSRREPGFSNGKPVAQTPHLRRS